MEGFRLYDSFRGMEIFEIRQFIGSNISGQYFTGDILYFALCVVELNGNFLWKRFFPFFFANIDIPEIVKMNDSSFYSGTKSLKLKDLLLYRFCSIYIFK